MGKGGHFWGFLKGSQSEVEGWVEKKKGGKSHL